MERVKAHDQVAFEHLVARHLSAIHGYLMRLMRSHADAEDLAQETFLRVWSKAASYRPGTVRFSTWLHRIAHNLCMDELRRQRPDSLEDPDAIESQQPGLERELAARQANTLLDRALSDLPANQRAALLLTEVQGLSNQQVADVMHLGVRAVESLLARARRTLRDRLLES